MSTPTTPQSGSTLPHKEAEKNLPPLGQKPTKRRFFILVLLFLCVAINYLDRTNMAVAAPAIQSELGIDAAMMGIIFSAFSWTYALMQVPGGIVLDRYGTRKTMGVALALWSGITCLFGLVSHTFSFIMLRLGLGFAESPAFSCVNRAVTSWFPAKERGLAVAGYMSGQFVGLAVCTPILAWCVVTFSWHVIFFLTGIGGLLVAWGWFRAFHEPCRDKKINEAELQYLSEGGALICRQEEKAVHFQWSDLPRLLRKRELWGIYLGKFAQASTLFFYFTWFPSYLVNEKGMSLIKAGLWAVIPYTAAIGGVFFGGLLSDWLSKKTGNHTLARKLPVITGMLLCSTIFLANFTNIPGLVILVLSVAFFGQGMAGIIESAICDMVPSDKVGTTVGLCQFCANLGGALTPLVIGFIIKFSGSYVGGLVYVSVIAVLGVCSILFLVKKVERVTF